MDLGWYLRSPEQLIIFILANYGLTSERNSCETDVWLDANPKASERKFAPWTYGAAAEFG